MTFDAWWQHWLELNRSNIRPGPECECSEKVSARAAWQQAHKEKDDELSRLKAAVRQVIDNVDFDKREVHSFAALRVLQNAIGYLRDKPSCPECDTNRDYGMRYCAYCGRRFDKNPNTYRKL